MVAAAVVGTVASIGSGIVQSSAASKAAKAQTNAANQANATEREFFGESQKALQPFIDTGQAANKKIEGLEGIGEEGSGSIMSTLQGLPGYQFSLQQGLKSVQNSNAARGLGTSGAAQKGAANYATGLANQYYNNYLTGIQNTANTGAGSAASLSGAATSTGNQMGQNTIGAGNAQAAGAVGQGNAVSGAIGGTANALIASSLLQNSQNQGGIYRSADSNAFQNPNANSSLPWSSYYTP